MCVIGPDDNQVWRDLEALRLHLGTCRHMRHSKSTHSIKLISGRKLRTHQDRALRQSAADIILQFLSHTNQSPKFQTHCPYN